VGSYDTRGGYAGANIFQATDNIDKVLKQMAKLETKVQNELIKDSRKAMKDTVKSYRPKFKKMTPKKTGALRNSVKLKSRSKRGITKVALYWDSPYAGYVNFWKESPHYRRVTSAYRSNKAKMSRSQMIKSARAVMVDYLRQNASVTALVDAEDIQDIDFEFEDLYNASANRFSFPAVSVETSFMNLNDQLNCKDVNLYTETLDFTIYNQVDTTKLRSRSASVRATAEAEKRKVDTVRAIIQEELRVLDGDLISEIDVQKVQINTASDSIFSTDSNTKIYQSFFSINITYKTI
jgi:hypothetical protein